MSSYNSTSSFGNRSSFSEGSDASTSPTQEMGRHMQHLEPMPPVPEGEGNEPLDHPVLSTYHRDTVVPDRWLVESSRVSCSIPLLPLRSLLGAHSRLFFFSSISRGNTMMVRRCCYTIRHPSSFASISSRLVELRLTIVAFLFRRPLPSCRFPRSLCVPSTNRMQQTKSAWLKQMVRSSRLALPFQAHCRNSSSLHISFFTPHSYC
jgi:hypothetical protein